MREISVNLFNRSFSMPTKCTKQIAIKFPQIYMGFVGFVLNLLSQFYYYYSSSMGKKACIKWSDHGFMAHIFLFILIWMTMFHLPDTGGFFCCCCFLFALICFCALIQWSSVRFCGNHQYHCSKKAFISSKKKT